MDTKALRQKILDLAIRGKLVPQDPSDEPASVLLDRIRAEKQQMVKEGKLKAKDVKNDSVIFKGEDNLHYEKFADGTVILSENEYEELPAGWVWCNLGFLFNHNTGKALNSSKTEGQALTYITTSNVYWDKFVLDNLKTMSFTDEEIVKCTVEKGDLLVCEGGDIGRSAIWESDEPIRIQNHLHRLRAYNKINTKFYYYVLYLYKANGNINGNGIGLQGFSSNAVHSLIVPLPPISEQERIVSEVESAFDIINGIENNKLELDSYIEAVKSKILDLAVCGKLVPQDPTDEPASVLLERIRAEKEELIEQGKIKRDKDESVIFKGEDNSYYHRVEKGELVQIKKLSFPSGWTVCSITDIAYSVGNKNNQVQNKEISENGLYPVISQSKDFIDGYCDLKNKVISDLPLILFGDHTRNVKYINFPFVIGADGTKLFKIILANDKYIYYWMIYAAGNIIDKGYARHLGALKQECLYLPPLKEQNRIVKAIEDAFTTVDSIAENL